VSEDIPDDKTLKPKSKFRRRIIILLLVGPILLYLIGAVVLNLHSYIQVLKIVNGVNAVRLGDSKATVMELMGEPERMYEKGADLKIFHLEPDSLERWAYRGNLEWSWPFDFYFSNDGFDISIFGPSESKLVIAFDDSGKVAFITDPIGEQEGE